MTNDKPSYVHGLVRIPLPDGRHLELPPQECWQVIEQIREFLFDRYRDFNPPPVKVVQKNRRNFRVRITKYADFWRSVEVNFWEPDTFRIFDAFILPDTCFLDIGAWIGPTALYGAQLAKRTFAFEPDPVAYQELEANLRVNTDAEWASRLTIFNKAVSSKGGVIKLGNRTARGDSQSSVLFSNKANHWEAQSTRLDQFIEAEKLQDEKLFIKIDIEGGEYELVPSLKKMLSRNHVVLLLSLHPTFLLDSLLENGGESPLARIPRRILAAWHQFNLIYSLPFAFFYHTNGRRIHPVREFLRGIICSRFLTEIVATNQIWENMGSRL